MDASGCCPEERHATPPPPPPPTPPTTMNKVCLRIGNHNIIKKRETVYVRMSCSETDLCK